MNPNEHQVVFALVASVNKHIEILRAVGFEPKDLTEKIEAVKTVLDFRVTEETPDPDEGAEQYSSTEGAEYG